MPEGHTIHRLARDLRRDLVDTELEASSPQGRFASGAKSLDGQVLTATEAAGKHLFLHAGPNLTLYIHLGLIGKFRRFEASTNRGDAVRLRFEREDFAWSLTGPHTCRLIEPPEVEEIIARLGPDPLRRRSSPDQFIDKAAKSNKAIGALLLDQNVIAGIGNVYRSELLFLAGIHPATPAKNLDGGVVRKIWDTTVELLRLGVRLDRIVTVTRADANGTKPGRLGPDNRLYAYKRTGEPCRRCDTPIATAPIAGRSIWWCPRCQPAR
ncbi:MAG: Fpg/Nei family DNA glycosylase [Actinobacteria bacterium]|nr:Fpg/Nei family DNA glycosylase [Actinomycetota bacterium]